MTVIWRWAVGLADAVGDWLSAFAANDRRWNRMRFRAMAVLIGFGLFFLFQTVIIYSPTYLISAQYHGRGRGIPHMQSLAKHKKEKHLGRLFGLYEAYHGDLPITYEGDKFHRLSR